MQTYLTGETGDAAIAITPVNRTRFKEWLTAQPAATQTWVNSTGFTGEPGTVCLLPGPDGAIARVLFGLDEQDPWCWAHLPGKLPAKHSYRIDAILDARTADWASLAWQLACYQFTTCKTVRAPKDWPRLVWPDSANQPHVQRTVEAVALVRDLVNAPSGDMGPEDLGKVATQLAARFGAQITTIVGDALLDQNYPMIHAVGRASTRAPRLIDLRWGEEQAPKITIVGKGVCFDSGGLDLKSSSNMKLMKKDMGGAAHALGLALMIMDAKLPVRLRVLIPAVENSVSGNAFRPLDVLKSRKGTTVEVGNTDAEGRLILADCLCEADSEKPALLIDMATLTGAARTALGPDLPVLLTQDEALAADMQTASAYVNDPLWRLPLWKAYRRFLDSKTADISSASDSPFAGAITAGLFLQDFVSSATAWAHIDLFAWNPSARPGRPEGGEAMTIRALFHLIASRYAS